MKNIVEVIESYNIKLYQTGNDLYRASCPFHTETDASFTVYPHTDSFHCFGCGASGDAISFIRLIQNISYREALSVLNLKPNQYSIKKLKSLLKDKLEPDKDILKLYLLANKILHKKQLYFSPAAYNIDIALNNGDTEFIKKFITSPK